MPSLLVTSALLDATLGVGVYLQATTVEADKLAGVSTQNVLLQTSGAPLVLTRIGRTQTGICRMRTGPLAGFRRFRYLELTQFPLTVIAHSRSMTSVCQ